MADHPGIIFREAASGRRPALMGHRLDVSQVIETVKAEGGDAQAAAEYFGVNPALVRAAISYYGEYRGEVESWIERERVISEEAETAWRGEQAALQG